MEESRQPVQVSVTVEDIAATVISCMAALYRLRLETQATKDSPEAEESALRWVLAFFPADNPFAARLAEVVRR